MVYWTCYKTFSTKFVGKLAKLSKMTPQTIKAAYFFFVTLPPYDQNDLRSLLMKIKCICHHVVGYLENDPS